MSANKVTVEDSECLTVWDVAVNNMSSQARHRLAAMQWELILRDHTVQAPLGLSESQRTVCRSSLPANACTFTWPRNNGQTLMVIVCTKPDCALEAFSRHPLKRRRAAIHFANHGLHLAEDEQVVSLFGFEGKQHEATLNSSRPNRSV